MIINIQMKIVFKTLFFIRVLVDFSTHSLSIYYVENYKTLTTDEERAERTKTHILTVGAERGKGGGRILNNPCVIKLKP